MGQSLDKPIESVEGKSGKQCKAMLNILNGNEKKISSRISFILRQTAVYETRLKEVVAKKGNIKSAGGLTSEKLVNDKSFQYAGLILFQRNKLKALNDVLMKIRLMQEAVRKVYFAVHNREVYKNVMDSMKKIDLEKIVKNVSTENEQEIIGKIQEVANSDTQIGCSIDNMNSNRNTEQEASEDSRETKIEEILNEFENMNEKEVEEKERDINIRLQKIRNSAVVTGAT